MLPFLSLFICVCSSPKGIVIWGRELCLTYLHIPSFSIIPNPETLKNCLKIPYGPYAPSSNHLTLTKGPTQELKNVIKYDFLSFLTPPGLHLLPFFPRDSKNEMPTPFVFTQTCSLPTCALDRSPFLTQLSWARIFSSSPFFHSFNFSLSALEI